MAITFTSIDLPHTLAHSRAVKQWLKEVILAEGHTLGDVSIAWCSDDYILSSNVQYLGHNYPTDIITFGDNQGNIISGDLLISLETVKRNGEVFGEGFHVEQLRVMVHGVLHLCGYDDHTPEEQKVMREKENFYINKFKA
ncbi:MAG: rRNA maturation RNase YbeY [Mucinivorans sp.]